MKEEKRFEDYLKEVHAKNYHGTDDNMPDAFEAWVSELEVGDVIKYAEEALLQQRDEFLNQPANQHDQEIRRQVVEEMRKKIEGTVELWLLRLHNEPKRWTVDRALSDILTIIDSMI